MKLIKKLEVYIVLIIISVVFLPNLNLISFHPDESHWIGLSGAYEDFLATIFEGKAWEKRPSQFLNPTMTYYAIGIARQFGEITKEELNPTYVFGKTFEENQNEGRVPSDNLLWWGRLAVTCCAVLGLWLTFLIFRQAAPWWISYLWISFAIINPYLRDILRRAMNEGVLLFFIALVTWVLSKAVERSPKNSLFKSNWTFYFLIVLAGILTGFAIQTKTNAATLLFGLWLILTLAIWREKIFNWKIKIKLVSTIFLILTTSSFTGFIATNPVLWTDTVHGIGSIIKTRINVLDGQTENSSQSLTTMPITKRLNTLSTRIFIENATLPVFFPTGLLFIAGLGLIGFRLKQWVQNKHNHYQMALITIIGFSVSFPMLFTPLDWSRFYLLPIFYSGIIEAVGLGLLIEWAFEQIKKTSLLMD